MTAAPPGRLLRAAPLAAFPGDCPRLAPAYLARQERLGCIAPAWRFAWECPGGRLAAWVTYWGLPGADRPLLIDALWAPDGAHDPARALLAASLEALAIDSIDYLADRAPGGARVPRSEPDALEACRFALVATQTRLERTGRAAVAERPPLGVSFRAADAARDDLARLLAATQVDSLDRATGTGDPAEQLATLSKLEREPGWWQLAVDAGSGRPLGMVLPARAGDGGGVIAYVGVTPEARGRGLGRALLARATTQLLGDPVTSRVVADVDDENRPMLRAAAAAGYRPFAARAHYRRSRT